MIEAATVIVLGYRLRTRSISAFAKAVRARAILLANWIRLDARFGRLRKNIANLSDTAFAGVRCQTRYWAGQGMVVSACL